MSVNVGCILAELLCRRPLEQPTIFYFAGLVSYRSLPISVCRSVGCILAELLRRKPLFPGKNYLDQLNLIVNTLGKPSEPELGFVTQDNAHAYISKMPPTLVRLLSNSPEIVWRSLTQESARGCGSEMPPAQVREPPSGWSVLCLENCRTCRGHMPRLAQTAGALVED